MSYLAICITPFFKIVYNHFLNVLCIFHQFLFTNRIKHDFESKESITFESSGFMLKLFSIEHVSTDAYSC